MTVGEALLLGATQGVTEFLPISSSGHLLLIRRIFNLSPPSLQSDLFLHLATLLVVIIYYRKKILLLLRGRENSLLFSLLIATLTTVIVALPLTLVELPENFIFPAFLLTSLILLLPKWVEKPPVLGYPWWQGVVIGAAQGIASLAGLSRLAFTLVAALSCGMGREEGVEYSFLLSIPTVVGALLFSLWREGGVAPLPTLVGGVTAFVVGLLTLPTLIKVVKGGRLWYFSTYLVTVGLFGWLLKV
ncbi:MAG: undecaprenyl-diphosphate phosphatase [Sphaerochaetaceae bacterium]|nr:undecaprenyl-diphosphate phosphatase [Sphaerochaetaceae bacterium]HHU89018.1 undecaprenyl-diphosphate phosphatase [Spirochaetales bacterium]